MVANKIANPKNFLVTNVVFHFNYNKTTTHKVFSTAGDNFVSMMLIYWRTNVSVLCLQMHYSMPSLLYKIANFSPTFPSPNSILKIDA